MATAALPSEPRPERPRRSDVGLPPVWWAACKVVAMAAVLVGVLVGLPVLAVRLVGALAAG